MSTIDAFIDANAENFYPIDASLVGWDLQGAQIAHIEFDLQVVFDTSDNSIIIVCTAQNAEEADVIALEDDEYFPEELRAHLRIHGLELGPLRNTLEDKGNGEYLQFQA